MMAAQSAIGTAQSSAFPPRVASTRPSTFVLDYCRWQLTPLLTKSTADESSGILQRHRRSVYLVLDDDLEGAVPLRVHVQVSPLAIRRVGRAAAPASAGLHSLCRSVGVRFGRLKALQHRVFEACLRESHITDLHSSYSFLISAVYPCNFFSLNWCSGCCGNQPSVPITC